MRILKVRHKKSRTEVVWHRERNDGKGVDKVSVESYDEPEPSFVKAIEAILPHVLEMLALAGQYGKNMIVSTVNFSYRNEVMGVVISLEKRFDDGSCLCFNTPYKPESSEGGSPVLSEGLVSALNRLQVEAENYARGRKSQLELPLDVAERDAAVEADELQILATTAMETIKELGRASVSVVQRTLKINPIKAAKVMDILEERGIVGPPQEKGGAREILIDAKLDGATTGKGKAQRKKKAAKAAA